MYQIIAHSVHNFININRTESNAQDSFNICFNFSSFSNFALLYSRVGAGAGAASKFLPGAGAAYKYNGSATLATGTYIFCT
jgi:hypothetical protein